MGRYFAPTYVNLAMGYYEIKVYFIIYQSNALASKYFENSWLKFFRQLSNVTEG